MSVYSATFNIRDIAELEKLLTDTLHNETEIRRKLGQVALSDYLVNITVDELVSAMF